MLTKLLSICDDWTLTQREARKVVGLEVTLLQRSADSYALRGDESSVEYELNEESTQSSIGNAVRRCSCFQKRPLLIG